MTGFRGAWTADLKWRVVDVIGHAVLVFFLPGPWWLQWLPDMLLPVLWIHGMVTNRFLPPHSELINSHRSLHDPAVPLVLLWVGGVVHAQTLLILWVGLHWAGHVLWDRLTHQDWERLGL